MRPCQRYVYEKTFRSVSLYEVDGTVNKTTTEYRLVWVELDDRIPVVERQVRESLTQRKSASLPGIAGQFGPCPGGGQARIFVGRHGHEWVKRPHVA